MFSQPPEVVVSWEKEVLWSPGCVVRPVWEAIRLNLNSLLVCEVSCNLGLLCSHAMLLLGQGRKMVGR